MVHKQNGVPIDFETLTDRWLLCFSMGKLHSQVVISNICGQDSPLYNKLEHLGEKMPSKNGREATKSGGYFYSGEDDDRLIVDVVCIITKVKQISGFDKKIFQQLGY